MFTADAAKRDLQIVTRGWMETERTVQTSVRMSSSGPSGQGLDSDSGTIEGQPWASYLTLLKGAFTK